MKLNLTHPLIEVVSLETADSTNNVLKNYVRKDKSKPYVLAITDYQTAGRGQRGNFWESVKGKNLLFSLMLYPTTIAVTDQFLLSQIISLSVKEALDQYTSANHREFSIKWPNDIYWKDFKICGILIENDFESTHLERTIIGVGLNVNQEEFMSSAPNPISLKQITGTDLNREELLHDIILRFENYYRQLVMKDYGEIRHCYTNGLYRLGVEATYRDANGEFKARLREVKNDGVLILEDEENQLRHYLFKEIAFVI